MAKMEDAELVTIVGAKITGAVGYQGGTLSNERLQADRFYRGEPFGDEQAGQSQVVSRDVAEAVDSMLPALMKIFASSDKLGTFDPRSPKEDRQGEPPGTGAKRAVEIAKQATDYVNWIFWTQNGGFLLLHNWFKDALMKKLGVVKCWWDEQTDVTKETYEGLIDDELAALKMDPDLEIVSLDSRTDEAVGQALQSIGIMQPGMGQVHDVVVRRTKQKGRIRVMAVPPDEFLADHRGVSLDELPFSAHRRKATVSDLIEMGFDRKKVEALGSDNGQDFNPERLERFKDEDAYPYRSDSNTDPSMREIWITEAYVKIDFDGDGVAELRKITVAGESSFELLENEEVDSHPFCTLTPVPVPHKLYGLSIADQTMDLQRIKSALWRGLLNSIYLANAPRHGFVEGQVNLDDLLDARPGGVVRMKSPNALFPIATSPVNESAFQAIEYADSVREARTGVRRFVSTLNPDQNNPYSQTATGARLVEDASKDRLQLIARLFGQTGVTDLFRRMLELTCKHQQAPMMVRLRNKFVPMDPREWSTEMDVTTAVGIGTGDKSSQLGRAMSMVPVFQSIIQMQGGPHGPLVTMDNVYNLACKLTELNELGDVELYVTDPQTAPPPPPAPPDPHMIKAQAEADAAKARAQAETTRANATMMEAEAESKARLLDSTIDAHGNIIKAKIAMAGTVVAALIKAGAATDQNIHSILGDIFRDAIGQDAGGMQPPTQQQGQPDYSAAMNPGAQMANPNPMPGLAQYSQMQPPPMQPPQPMENQ